MAILDVISPCTTWLPIFWGKYIQLFAKNKAALPDSHADQDSNNAQPIEISPLDTLPVVDGPLPDLPSDIIAHILSRLPAKCIFRLQGESKVLYDLTTTPFFTQTHLSRANSPCIVVQSLDRSWNNNIKIFIFDEKAEDRVEAIRLDLNLCDIHCGGESMILFDSHDGFLLFKSDDICPSEVFCIVNPITKQQVTVTTSSYYRSYVCGFYFHPRKQEYELLYVCLTGGGQNEFYILSLGNNCRRSAGSFCYRPTNKRPAVIINGTLYWMVDRIRYLDENHVFPSLSHSLIISFNIESEELRTMEAVVPYDEATPARYGEPLQLFEMEGDLCLFDSSAKFSIFSSDSGKWVTYGVSCPQYFYFGRDLSVCDAYCRGEVR